jgi:large subunit ribosomal protein L22
MSKQTTPRAIADSQAMAILRGVKGSVQKAELVLGLIRGKKVEQALNDLTFCDKRMAEPLRKTLVSAISNAEQNHGLNVDMLVVDQVFAGKNMVLKCFNARARGRSTRIMKPTCQLTIIVAERAPVAKVAKAKPEAAKTAKPATKTAKQPAAAPKAAAPAETTEA